MTRLNIGLFAFSFILFFGCKTEPKSTIIYADNNVETSGLLDNGKEIASATFLALSTELQNAMKSGGLDHALSYCNENAIQITDSLSSKYNVDIKRTSLKFRNPNNRPSPTEKRILHQLENKKNSGKDMMPQVISDGNSKTYFAPIIVQDMCLKCHGHQDEIDNYAVIKELYPNDLAIGYKQGDLRGMWSISFRNNKDRN